MPKTGVHSVSARSGTGIHVHVLNLVYQVGIGSERSLVDMHNQTIEVDGGC